MQKQKKRVFKFFCRVHVKARFNSYGYCHPLYKSKFFLLLLRIVKYHSAYMRVFFHFEKVHLLISSQRSLNIRRILDSISCSGKPQTNYFYHNRKLSITNTPSTKNMEDYVQLFAMVMIGVSVCLSSTTVDPNMCG